jgi:cytochrome c oxidase assembly protein subunit 15
MLASMAMVCLCVWLLDLLWSPVRGAASRLVTGLAVTTFVVGWVVLWLGTVTTGSGPHSGDLDSKRTGLDPAHVALLHSYAVDVLVALTLALLVLGWRDRYLRLVFGALLGVEVLQGVVGWVQYETGLPAWVVGLHMLGAGLTAAGLARALLATRPHRLPKSPSVPAEMSLGSLRDHPPSLPR